MTKRGRPQRDLTGKRSGRLTALYSLERRNKCGHVLWFCSCDCGGETIVASGNLTQEHTKSCGCLQHYLLAHRKLVSAKHKATGIRLYPRDYDRAYLSKYLSDLSLHALVAEPSQARIEQTEFHCLQ